ncbi:MAG TPA: hypothetical protein VLJ20_12765 [Acetobacteraceae bacterium]|nr:hypothetical protein [Acetobacteraceae bacterium]
MTKEEAELDATGLFDRAFYTATYPDIPAAAADPLAHFCGFGWREGRRPNPWFEPAWYLATNADVRKSGLNPLLHYSRHGEAEGRRPAPQFDPAWYAEAHRVPRRGALHHFLTHRLDGTALPLADLYAVRHIAPYRDHAARGEDPFLRYIADALRDGHTPLPDAAVIGTSGVFDPNHYFINSTDVHERALDPVEHFCRHGWRENRKPCLYFDTGFYRRTNPEPDRLGINPLAHYLLEGEAAGRRPVVFFDPVWYRRTYAVPDGQSALAHFLVHRRGQRVSPNAHFDVAWYLERNPLGPNRDPFAHFLRAGTYGDRDPSPDFDAGAYRKRVLGRPSRHFRRLLHPERDNPLVHWLGAQYEAAPSTLDAV